jgi:hypothetical protein
MVPRFTIRHCLLARVDPQFPKKSQGESSWRKTIACAYGAQLSPNVGGHVVTVCTIQPGS